MATYSSLPLLLPLLVFSLLAAAARSAGEGADDVGLMLGRSGTKGCQGSMMECFNSNEFEMNSENKRRMLATTQYISYRSLMANYVPCSERGASYYNCVPGANANPYTRGCSAITRCHR